MGLRLFHCELGSPADRCPARHVLAGQALGSPARRRPTGSYETPITFAATPLRSPTTRRTPYPFRPYAVGRNGYGARDRHDGSSLDGLGTSPRDSRSRASLASDFYGSSRERDYGRLAPAGRAPLRSPSTSLSTARDTPNAGNLRSRRRSNGGGRSNRFTAFVRWTTPKTQTLGVTVLNLRNPPISLR